MSSLRFDYEETEFAGLPVQMWDEDDGYGEAPADPSAVAWQLKIDEFEEADPETFEDNFETMLELTGPAGPTALVIGQWGGAGFEIPPPVDLLIRNAGRLTALRSLFIGALTTEDAEVSWIQLGDLTPVLNAFPALERLWVRGGPGLELSPLRHEGLRELVLQGAGLPLEVVHAVGASDLPNLTSLELWPGTHERQSSGHISPADFAPILQGRSLPALTQLGLCNTDMTDELAAALASAPVVARLKGLNLEKGVLGDEGAAALLAGQPLTHLEWLNLDHHYLSAEMEQRLIEAMPGVTVRSARREWSDDDKEQGIRWPGIVE
ncbi:MAG: STM4015 family protein [Actinoplanes sp.]